MPDPPLAFAERVIDVPVQMGVVPFIVTEGLLFTEMDLVLDAEQPALSVTVTLYVILVVVVFVFVGFTVILDELALVSPAVVPLGTPVADQL